MIRVLFVIILLLFAGYATYRGLQVVATVCLFGLFCIVCKNNTLRFLDLAFSLFAKMREAKFGDTVIKIGETELNLPQLQLAPPWIRLVISSLSNQEISLLMQTSALSSYEIHPAHKKSMRNLRSHGLIFHNQPSMADSTTVSLTERGRDLATFLLYNKSLKIRSEVAL